MIYRYVPLLRTKSGEVAALGNLAGSARARLLPIIHVTESPPTTFATQMGKAWANLPMALDGTFNYGVTGATSTFTSLFADLNTEGVAMVPSIECDAPLPYVAAVKKLVRGNGLIVKASIRQLGSVDAWVATNGFDRATVDLVVTAGAVASFDPVAFGGYIAQALKGAIPTPSPWRSVTLASSAAPRDFSSLAVGRTPVPRLDWNLWQQVHPQVSFQLDYGDYGISHPDLTEPPGIAMARATVSVRYPTPNEWVMIKGNPTTGKRAKPMGQQYIAHAKALTKEPNFGGVPNCWGDDRIKLIGGGGASSGSRATWVGISTNRHLQMVATILP